MLTSYFEEIRKSTPAPVSYVNGKRFDDSEDKSGLVIAPEDNHFCGSFDPEPAKFETDIDGKEGNIYHLRHIEATVIGEFVVFNHLFKTGGAVYKINKKGNTLVTYQYAACSIFGLSGSKLIAIEQDRHIDVLCPEEWENFVAVLMSKNIADEKVAMATKAHD